MKAAVVKKVSIEKTGVTGRWNSNMILCNNISLPNVNIVNESVIITTHYHYRIQLSLRC